MNERQIQETMQTLMRATMQHARQLEELKNATSKTVIVPESADVIVAMRKTLEDYYEVSKARNNKDQKAIGPPHLHAWQTLVEQMVIVVLNQTTPLDGNMPEGYLMIRLKSTLTQYEAQCKAVPTKFIQERLAERAKGCKIARALKKEGQEQMIKRTLSPGPSTLDELRRHCFALRLVLC
jgi:hypothetical protein